ncbi:eCIS core domain-containing protein [Roseobacter sinensis]|uniref:DUF4157 domain-containing protein n=1 Tax=Roseobacter sinensis TaxID=2931391 RepID=A0ABT3BLI8_9RHOB|nr:DUF4157 domain-containing protein [Roseobacter sp. WL0113]MCV3274442.1 DUF4157 domain-containing protein [Roseobacter sp. WL0113]
MADKSSPVQRLAAMTSASDPTTQAAGAQERAQTTQRSEAETASTSHAPAGGLPRDLRSGIENLSGMDMGDVRVHRGSTEPARIGALAYAQGRDIHLASGQERHLPHEAWHVVQQAQGRVAQTRQAMGVALNDDPGLEAEADQMGQRALSAGTTQIALGSEPPNLASAPVQQKPVVQRLAGFEIELRIPFYGSSGVATDDKTFKSETAQQLAPNARKQVVDFLFGGNKYGVSYGRVDGQYDVSADHSSWHRPHKELRKHIKRHHLGRTGKQPSMSIPEYRTVPLEERDPETQARMATIAAAVQIHANESVRRAQLGHTNALSAPVQDQMTGIPVAALRALLTGDDVGTELLNNMINELQPSLYYQSTVGVLPSEIPALFEEAAADMDDQNPDTAKAGLLRHSVARVDAALNSAEVAPFVGVMDPGHKASLRGWMTLVAQLLLADQLEVSSTRYYVKETEEGEIVVRRSGVRKNLVPYLPKTDLKAARAALPPAVRPSPHAGPNARNWHNLFQALFENCHPNNFDLVTTLGLENYENRDLYDKKGKKIGKVEHGEIFGVGSIPGTWLYLLISDQTGGENHLKSGNELSLDDKQEELKPELSIRGEQAIPLEDRAASSKASFGSSDDIDGIEDRLMNAWNSAVDRRIASTKDRADYQRAYDAVRPQFDALGSFPTIHGQLRRMRAQFDALASPDNLEQSSVQLQALDLEFKAWRANNPDAHLALLKLILLIENPGWAKKAIGRGKVPTGVHLMRAELAARHADNTTLTNLRDIATARLAAGGLTRRASTKNLYTLVRDTPGWIGNGGGWTSFVALYSRTDRAV